LAHGNGSGFHTGAHGLLLAFGFRLEGLWAAVTKVTVPHHARRGVHGSTFSAPKAAVAS
jgi:hypothetical protein